MTAQTDNSRCEKLDLNKNIIGALSQQKVRVGKYRLTTAQGKLNMT